MQAKPKKYIYRIAKKKVTECKRRRKVGNGKDRIETDGNRETGRKIKRWKERA
jgi:hypothetical protein